MCNPRCSSRLFFYSPQATDQFKTDLESSCNWYDAANDGMTYTPHVATFIVAVLGAVQLQTNKLDIVQASLIFGILSLVIPATSVFLTGIFKTISVNSEATADELIVLGKTNGYFDQVPTFPLAIPPLSLSPRKSLS